MLYPLAVCYRNPKVAAKTTLADHPQPSEDRRRSPRFQMAIPALLEFTDGEVISITITDMSLVGFAGDCQQMFKRDADCFLKLPTLPATQRFAMMESRVVRCDGNLMGCSFVRMLNPCELEPFLAEYKVAA